MAIFCHLFGSLRVHFIFQEEQLVMEMLDGISEGPPFVATIGKCSRNSYSSYRILAKNEVPKGKKYVWLTFDDGVEDFYTIVYPLLKKYKMTATNNIITDFTQKEKENVLTFDQIKEMKSAGLTFESHTVNHPDLANSSLETQKNELVASKRLLDKVLDQNTSVIVYPSGRYSQVTIDQAKKADYKLGLTTKNGLASSADGLYSLKRVRILPTTTGEDLLAMIQE